MLSLWGGYVVTHQPNETKPMVFKRLTETEITVFREHAKPDEIELFPKTSSEHFLYCLDALQSAYAEIDRLVSAVVGLDFAYALKKRDAHAKDEEIDELRAYKQFSKDDKAAYDACEKENDKLRSLLSSAKEMAEFYGDKRLYEPPCDEDCGCSTSEDSPILLEHMRDTKARAWLEEYKKHEDGK